MTNLAAPRTGYQQLPAKVFASLLPGELKIVILPGNGLANGGVMYDVPVSVIPAPLRVPNTALWVSLDEHMCVVRAWRREDEVNVMGGHPCP